MTKKGRKKLASRILSFALSIILVGTTFYGDYRVAYADEITVEEAAETPAEVSTEAPAQTEPAQQEVVEATSSDVTVPTEVSEESVVSDETAETVISETISDEEISDETAETVETEETLETETEETEETETETETEETEEVQLEFNQSVTVNGILISLYAKPGVLPNDAKLQVSALPQKEEEAIKEAIDEETVKDVEKTYSFDINIYSAEKGGFVQPKDGTVSVTFDAIPEGNSKDTTVEVFHVEKNGTDVKNVESVSGESKTDEITFGAKHFSVYTVTIYNTRFPGNAGTFQIDLRDADTNESLGTPQTVTITVSSYDTKKNPSDIAPALAGYTFDRATTSNGTKIYKFRLKRSGNKDTPQYSIKQNPYSDSHWTNATTGIVFYYKNNKPAIKAKVCTTSYVAIKNGTQDIQFNIPTKDYVVNQPVTAEQLASTFTAPDGYKFLTIIKNSSNTDDGYIPVKAVRLTYTDSSHTAYKVQYTQDNSTWKEFNNGTLYFMCRPNTASTTDYHLDLGFKKDDYDKYKNGGAKVYAKVGDGSRTQIYFNQYDDELGTYDYRLTRSTSAFKANENIKFEVEYQGNTYELVADEKMNNEAFERCFYAHYTIQDTFGFDYKFTFTQDFDLAGDVVYHNFNDDRDTIETQHAEKINWTSQNQNETKQHIVKTVQEIGFTNAGHSFEKWVDKDGTEIKAGDPITVKNGEKVDLYAVWSENEIAVAVYASDGTKNVRVNAALKDKLGLNYVQKDGYYPIGVVMIPESLVLGKQSPYLNSQADFDALKPYLAKINTSYLTGGKNSGNTVASNLNYVQLDYGKGGNQSYTAFFDWNQAEYGSNYGEGGVFADGRTATGVSINNPQVGNFKYHIDLRFDTHIVSYKGSYYTNNAFDQTKDLTEIAYFAGTSVTKEMAQAVAAEYVNGYNVEGLYTDANLTQKFEGISSLTANSTIYVKYTKVTNFTITYKDGYTGGGDGKVLYTTQAPYGSDTPTYKDPTRKYYVFNGWTPQVASIVTGDATYVATWKQQFEPGSVELKAFSDTKTYDATSLAAKVEFTKKPTDFDNYFVVSNVVYTGQTSITDSGTANYKIDSLKIVEKSTNEDYTSYFNPKITKNGTLTVTPIKLTIGTGSDSKPFGQVARSYEITVNSVKQILDSDNKANYKPIQGKNETLKIWTTSSKRFPLPATEDNEYKVSFENGAKKQNYELTSNLGKLSITTAEVAFVLKADNQTWTYDGTAKSYDIVTVVSQPAGYESYKIEAHVTADSKITEVGTADNVIDADTIVIKDAKDNDVTANFDKSKIVLQKGTLTVTAREITVKSGDADKTYDGMPLQEESVSVIAGELAPNQKLSDLVSFSNFASITKAGKVDNTYSHSETDLAKKNYTITYRPGELEITPVEANVMIKAPTVFKTYDGTALTAEAAVNQIPVSVAGLITGDEAIVEVSGSATNVTDGNVTLKITKVTIRDKETKEDRTESYDADSILPMNGWLYINPVEIYVTTGTDSKVFDGTPLTKDDAQVVGLVNNEKATVHTTASLIDVGSTPNSYGEIAWGRVNSGNYKHNKDKDQIGTLTVTGYSNAVTITADSDSKVYDGTDLTKVTYTVTGLPKDASGKDAFTVEAVITGSQKNVGSTDNVVESYVIKDKADKAVATTNFTNIKTVDGTLTVTKRPVTVESATQKDFTYNGKPHTNKNVTITEFNEANKVGFVVGEGITVDVTGSVTYPSEGEVDNTFSYTANRGTILDNYEITKVVGKLQVVDTVTGNITVTAKSGENLYSGQPIKVSGFTNANLTYTMWGETFVVTGLKAESEETNAGTYDVIVENAEANVAPQVWQVTAAGNVDVTDLVSITRVNGTNKINKRSVTLTSASGKKVHDGDPLTAQWLVENDPDVTEVVTVTGDGFAANEGAEYNMTGTQTAPGSSADTFTYTLNQGTLADNYIITTVEGLLEVTNPEAKYEVTVTANSDDVFYDGEVQSVSGVTGTTSVINGHTYTISGLSASAEATNVKWENGRYTSYPVDVVGTYTVVDDQNNVVTDLFDVKTVSGTLTIKPRSVTLQSASAEKEYDGSPLKTVDLVDAGKLNEEVSVVTKNEEGYGFVKNDRNSIRTTVNGSQTLPGSSKNSFDVTKVDAAIANNYIITTAEGDLVVKDRTDKYQVNLTANSAEKFYDGFALNVSGFVGYDDEIRVTFDGKDYIITGLEAEASQLDVIRDRNGNVLPTVVSVTGQAVVKNLAGDDLTEQFDVQTTNGTLKIKPRTVTLTSASAEKEYDGQPLTTKALVDKDELTEEVSATEYNATTGTGFVEGEGFTAIVTGSQTLVGVSDNTFNYELTDDTSAVNYNIDSALGKLTVKDRTDKYQVTVKAKSGSKFYDGQKMTVQGFEAAYEGREFTETAKGIQFVENDATYYITGLSAKADATKVSRDADKNVIAVEVPVKTALIGGMHVKDANGNDVTAQFDVTTLNGELVINPRQVTVTSATDEKEYDATPLTNDEVTATAFNAETGKGFLTEDTVSYDVTGSQTIVGSSDNTFDIIWADKDEEINYDVTKELGTLTVINREAPYEITVVANSDEFLYDGTEQTVTGFKEVRFAQEDEEDLVFEATEDGLVFAIGNENFKVSGLTVNAATSTDVVEDKPVTITGKAVVTDAGNNNVTSQFAVHTENGTLNVTPRAVTLVAGSDNKEFDGKALVKRTYYVANTGDGFATYTKDGVTVNEKTGITVYVKGSQTLVGTSDNVINRVEFDGQIAKAGNYIVTTEKGTLEVKTREPGNKIKVYIQLDIDQTGKNTKEVLYNGEEQSVSVDVIVNTDGTAEEIETGDEGNTEVEEDLTAPAEATEEAGILPVSKADETLLEKVLALGAMKVYAAEDGITKTVTYGGVTFEISGIKLSGGTGIDAGKYPVTIDLSGINVKLSGAPVDDNFEIVIVQPKITELVPAVQLGDAVYIDEDGNEVGGERQEEIVWVEQDVTLDPNVIGMLTIDPRNVTLIANSASGVATGQTLTANGYTVGTEDDGFVEGEEAGIKVTVEGAISTVGSVPNKITAWEFDEELAKAGNYIVHTVDGTLTLIAPATVNPPTGGGGGGGGDVLGARRGVEAITPEEGQVLGAARKSPKTSDANNAILWAMVMGSSALGMAAMMAQKRKKEEEQS